MSSRIRPELYWIEFEGPGRIGIMPRPRGGDWLGDEMAVLAKAGVACLVSLLTPEEIEELELGEEARHCEECGMRFLSFPIRDRDVPPLTEETVRSMEVLSDELRAGKNVAVHCRMGIGRSAMIAACLLASDRLESASELPKTACLLGRARCSGDSLLSVDQAFEKIARARGFSVPDTEEQREWARRFVDLRSQRRKRR